MATQDSFTNRLSDYLDDEELTPPSAPQSRRTLRSASRAERRSASFAPSRHAPRR